MANKEAFANNCGKFSNDLYRIIIEKDSVKNTIFSPFSIQTCLALGYIGAKGQTALEMKNALHFENDDVNVICAEFNTILSKYKNSSLLKIANKIYLSDKYELNRQYSDLISKSFGSEVNKINFVDNITASNQINKWVENKTDNKIHDLVTPNDFDSDTVSVLLNAIHFKGLWKTQFLPSQTQKEEFWINENESVKIDMMNNEGNFMYGSAGIFEELDACALQLPYKDCDLSMLIILPNKKKGLKNLEKKICNINISALIDYMSSETVNVKLPKFKIESKIDLNEPLQKLGMETMFSNKADFRNMLTEDISLKVSKVIHKAFIEVNEEGTEAAAATAGIIRTRRAIQLDKKYFNVDHPFLYMIISNNFIPLFFGSYYVPYEFEFKYSNLANIHEDL